MATNSSDGGSAYPDRDMYEVYSSGMSVRQWYKGMALRIIKPELVVSIDLRNNLDYPAQEKRIVDTVAKCAGEIADALIAEDAEFERGAK